MVTYRLATDADAEAGADLQRQCWREAYGPLADPGLLQARLADRLRFVEAWRRAVAGEIERWLAVDDDRLVGFAAGGPPRDERPGDWELHALYVLAEFHGTGVARELFARAVPPGLSCVVCVLEDNARARAFYEREGFLELPGSRERYAALDCWEVMLLRPGILIP